ncbi:hypothetical protein EST38_g7726 [Candolleomyces aberdarensis]|uniref:Uncharacterized protein n=1 Tax=Candolleomyces aberdarensis TaxID=2316362 RepID=A0A4Q2DHU1_9AGAR|nr:hypothetical protein EST38_g7726 [Candolleomyces aberdarensis]
MKFSYAVAAILLAGSASASTIEGLFRRQSVEDMLAAIPPACRSAACAPLLELQTTCANDANPQRCACTPKTLKDMEDCVTCVIREVTSASGGGSMDSATLQTAIDTAMDSFVDTCKAAGVDLANGGGSSGGTTAAGTPTNTSPAAANTSGASNNNNGGSNQNSGASRLEFAASALVAVAAGAALLA